VNALTSRDLLALRAGARLSVKLLSGREIQAELLGNPWVSPTGAPGPGRVRMTVLDVEHAARISTAADRLAASRSPFSPFTKAKHTINGTQITAVIQ
jgi:hypothetical protein